jgi:hypothetical protein
MEDLGPLFAHPGDLSDPTLGSIAAILAVVALGLCVWVLVRRSVTDALLAASLVTVPLVAVALSDMVLLERSKETEFCVTCHVMTPLLDTVTPEDKALAPLHITQGAVPTAQSCYTCHSGYGVHGNMSAKLAGVRHMLLELTGTYDLPLTLHGDFDLKSCLACHAEGLAFRSQPAHAAPEIQQALLSHQMGCTGTCHPAAHPPQALTGGVSQ